MPYKDPEAKKAWYVANKERVLATNRAWDAANKERRNAINRAWDVANAEKKRAYDMTKRPWKFRKAYDPLCRPFPAALDLASGEWVRCEQALLPAPDTSLAAHVAAAIIVIEDRLAEEEMAA